MPTTTPDSAIVSARALTARFTLTWVRCASSVFAQQPPVAPAEPPPGTWIGTAGAGMSLTSGNSGTVTYNVAFDVTRDPKTRNVQ